MSDPDLYYLDIEGMAAAIKSGELSPLDLTEAHLERIAEAGPFAIAYLEVYAEEARARARAAAARARRLSE